jgi:hypothetical protein
MKHLLTILFILCFSFAKAQINFEKGYFISNSGIKTQCLIKNIDWNDNPTQFEYKINPNDPEIKTGSIGSVAEFGIDNTSKFKRYKVNIERSGNDLKDISDSKNPKWKEEVLFLKVLIEGNATLFSYSDNSIYKYFLETKNSPVEQLIRIKYISYEKNPGQAYFDDSIRENNLFRQQLYTNLKCDAITLKELENTKYSKSSLRSIFEKYNSCMGSDLITNFKEKTKKETIIIRITPSINLITPLKIIDPNPYYNTSTSMDGKAVFKIGAEFEYILPFNNNIWSIFTNPAYQKYGVEKTYVKNDGFGSQGTDVTYNVVVDYSSVEIPLGIRRYFFLKNNGKIFVNAAYINNSTGNTKININNGKKILESGSSSNIALGVGGNFKNKFSVEFRFNSNINLLRDYYQWKANYSSLGLIFGYRIF